MARSERGRSFHSAVVCDRRAVLLVSLEHAEVSFCEVTFAAFIETVKFQFERLPGEGDGVQLILTARLRSGKQVASLSKSSSQTTCCLGNLPCYTFQHLTDTGFSAPQHSPDVAAQ